MFLQNNVTGAGMAPGLAEAIADAVDSLTATGTTQTDAYELRNAVNRFTTVASGAGARLFQRAQPGDEILVYNGGANALLVYPDVGASIDSSATNIPISVPSGAQARFVRHRTTVWSSSGESAEGLLFLPSGTGAQTRTVEAKLRDLVSTADYSTQGNYDTARDALTGTSGMSNLDVSGANFGQITVRSRGTNQNAYVNFRPSGTGLGTIQFNNVDYVYVNNTGGVRTTSAGPHAFGGGQYNGASQILIAGDFVAIGNNNNKLDIAETLSVAVDAEAAGIWCGPTIIEAASGTHDFLTGFYGKTLFTGAAATTTEVSQIKVASFAAPAGVSSAVCVQIDDAPTGATNNYSIRINGGNIKVAATTFIGSEVALLGPAIGFNSADLEIRSGTASVNWKDQQANVSIMNLTNGGVLTVKESITALSATGIPAGGTTGSGLKLSSTADFGVFFGSGAPSLSAAKGSLYLRSDGSATNNRAYINTDGSTTWTSLTTVA